MAKKIAAQPTKFTPDTEKLYVHWMAGTKEGKPSILRVRIAADDGTERGLRLMPASGRWHWDSGHDEATSIGGIGVVMIASKTVNPLYGLRVRTFDTVEQAKEYIRHLYRLRIVAAERGIAAVDAIPIT